MHMTIMEIVGDSMRSL